LCVKYFRHPPAAFWALTTAVLAVVLVLGLHVGSTSPTPAPLVGSSAPLSDEAPHAYSVMQRVAQVVVVSRAPADELNAWASETADMASAHAARRAREAGDTDPVALAYAAIAADARELELVDASDANAVMGLRGQIGLDRDRLGAAVAGVTVPGMPDAPASAGSQDKTLSTNTAPQTSNPTSSPGDNS
jgi:hypothetical protein